MVDNLKVDIARLEGEYKSLQTQIHAISIGDTKIFKLVLQTSAFIALFIGVGSIVTFKYNTDINSNAVDESKKQINNLVENTKKEISDIIGRSVITNATVYGMFDKSNSIFTQDLQRDYLSGNDTPFYKLALSFRENIDVEGTGVGIFVGSKISFSGPILNIMSSGPEGIDEYQFNNFKEGATMYLDRNYDVVPGYPNNYSFTYVIARKSCQEIMDLSRNLYARKDLGSIQITPIFRSIQNAPKPTSLIIDVKKLNTPFGCDFYQQKDNSK